MHNRVPILADWDTDIDMAMAFNRARTVLRAISYGHEHWAAEYGLKITVDNEALVDRHATVKAGTRRLLQLVALSRVIVEPVDPVWSMPNRRAVREVLAEMREELGVTNEYQRQLQDRSLPSWSIPDFPGLNDKHIVQAILDGRLSVGNPEQPEAVCWQYPTES
jgi:hypothetical protein